MKVTVIIPTYKPDYTLYECLKSLEEQVISLSEFECILILNGEREPYESEIREYISTSPLNINCIYTPEKGVSNARNIGIKQASGEYLTFIDSDDWVSESYLLGLLAETNENQMALADVRCFDVTYKSYFNDYLGKRYESLEPGVLYPHVKIRSYFSTPWGKLIPADVCRKFAFNEQFDFGEDGLFMFSVEPYLPQGVKATVDVVYYRRCVPESLSRNKRSKRKIISNQMNLLMEYWKIYLKNISLYNFNFFMLRNLAILSHIIRK